MRTRADELCPIDVVARRLGIRASAIRYYEKRGLVAPASWRSGRRWYGPAEVRRLAVIHFWQAAALMSLEDIRDLVDGPHPARDWPRVVADQLATLDARIAHLHQAREVLTHIHDHHRTSPPDGCPHYEALIADRP